MAMTVAVTGPTGEIGRATVDALERSPDVARIVGMARRPFDPAAYGWRHTDYRQGDVCDPVAVADLVRDVDVVIHLAFSIMGSRVESARVNLTGTRVVAEQTAAAARPSRLVYTSSVAAYGYHQNNPQPLTEDVPAAGSPGHYYSTQKAESERLVAAATAGTDLRVFVLRPCVVAGPRATALADEMPWRQLGRRLPTAVQQLLADLPGRALLPDPGVPLQLVHHDDVADAIVEATVGAAAGGAYNLAGEGTISLSDVARAIGAVPVPVPGRAAGAVTDVLARLPWLPPEVEWLQAVRIPMLMDTRRAREALGWRPQWTSAQTLQEMAEGLRRRLE